MMKYLVPFLAVLALVANVGCELDDGASGDVIGDTTGGGDTVTPAQYKYVRIEDETTPGCTGNPGPDIDGVKLIKAGKTYQTAAEITLSDLQGATCACAYTNDAERNDCVPEKGKVVDETDDGCDSDNKFISLHGGYIWVSFNDAGTPVVFENGDKIMVTEITGTSCGGQPEEYSVKICVAQDSSNCKDLGIGSEETTFDIVL